MSGGSKKLKEEVIMKKSAKLLALLLALVTLISLVPMTAFAAETINVTAQCYTAKDMKTLAGTYGTQSLVTEDTVTVSAETFGTYVKLDGKLYQFAGVVFGGALQNNVTVNYSTDLTVAYVPHYHNYKTAYNRLYHWKACDCGSKYGYEKHVDPATDEDSICTCSYKFSNNADLVTLWVQDAPLATRFNRNTTDYVANVHTYKEVNATKISVRTFDALATVEMPTDLTLREGANVFEITVTAEDRKTTKTYTVNAIKSAKVDGTMISTVISEDGEFITTAAPGAHVIAAATATLTENVAQRVAAQAADNESVRILLAPKFPNWAIKTTQVTISSAALETLAEECKADLVIRTFLADIHVPHDQIKELAKAGDELVFEVLRGQPVTFTISADGEEITVPSGVTMETR